MLPDRVSNPGLLTYESGALPIALRGLAVNKRFITKLSNIYTSYRRTGLESFCIESAAGQTKKQV